MYKILQTVWCVPCQGHNNLYFEKIDKFADSFYIAIVYRVYNDVEIIDLSHFAKHLIAKCVFVYKTRSDNLVLFWLGFISKT